MLIFVEPGPDGLTGLAERITAATKTRGQRVWVVLTQPEQVAAADGIVESTASVDAVMVVEDSHPATAGAALAAWTWLRHDAPSMALGSLRDSSGRVCRVATVTAQAPAGPPSGPDPTPAAAVGRAEQAWLDGLTAARTLGGETSQVMLGHSDTTQVVGALESTVAERIAVTTTEVLAEVRDWAPGELRWLLESAEQLVHELPRDEAKLTSAAVALGQAESALAQEAARTGFSGMFGRRKRVAALTQAHEQAQQQWRAAVLAEAEMCAQRSYAQAAAAALPELIHDSEVRWQDAAARRTQEAVQRWFAATSAAARQLTPPLPTAGSTAARTWGDASPEVRHHLLVPADAAAVLGDERGEPDEYDGVSVHSADGLPQPLALAWMLGLSATAFAPAGDGA